MECLEHPEALPPYHECRCGACARAREDSIPAKLRLLARRQLTASSLTSIAISDTILHRAFSTYIAGHIGLAEMQIELIVALAKQVDDHHKQLMSLVAMQPILMVADKNT